jgi:hypothetical protein
MKLTKAFVIGGITISAWFTGGVSFFCLLGYVLTYNWALFIDFVLFMVMFWLLLGIYTEAVLECGAEDKFLNRIIARKITNGMKKKEVG